MNFNEFIFGKFGNRDLENIGERHVALSLIVKNTAHKKRKTLGKECCRISKQ
jgi:hypothetical protein